MGETTPEDNQTPEKSFSNEDVERIVKERIATAKKKEAEKFADYNDLTAAKAELDKIKAGQKTDLEKIAVERDDYKTKYESLVAENDKRVKLETTRSKAKSLFEAAEINNHDGKAWRYIETLVSGEDDDDALATRIKDAKDIFGVRSVGGSGRNTVPPKPGEKTIDDEIKELETARIEAIKNHDPVTAGDLSTRIVALKMKRREATKNV